MAILSGLAMAAPPAEEQEVIEVRGQRMAVWPVDDLRERGFELRDVPREENAAWVYLEAVNAFADLPEPLQPVFEYAHTHTWPASAPALGEWLQREETRKALDLLGRAAAMEDCQMPCFGDPSGSVISILLPSLSHCRMLAKIAVAEGRRLEADKAYDAALEQYVLVMRMGNHLNQGLTLIESLVGISCWSLGNNAARDLVLRQRMPESALSDVVRRLEEVAPLRPTIQRGFEQERLFGLGIVDEFVSSPTRFVPNLQALAGNGVPAHLGRAQTGWDRLESRLGHLLLPDRTIKRHMRSYYDRLVELAKLPAHDPRVREFDEEKMIQDIPAWNQLARAFLPSLSRARILGIRCHAETAATQVAAALQLYSARHEGKSPVSLSELTEVWPDLERIDPFSGREFVYERNSEGWSLYSVGPDGEDDGGKTGERWDESGTDLVYTFPPKPVEPFEPQENE